MNPWAENQVDEYKMDHVHAWAMRTTGGGYKREQQIQGQKWAEIGLLLPVNHELEIKLTCGA